MELPRFECSPLACPLARKVRKASTVARQIILFKVGLVRKPEVAIKLNDAARRARPKGVCLTPLDFRNLMADQLHFASRELRATGKTTFEEIRRDLPAADPHNHVRLFSHNSAERPPHIADE